MLIIGGPAESEITRVRIEGIINALENKKNDVHIINGDYDFISQEAAVRDYLSVPQNQPDYIIGLNGILTLGAIAICHELKIYNNIKFFSMMNHLKQQIMAFILPVFTTIPRCWGRLLQNSFLMPLKNPTTIRQ